MGDLGSICKIPHKLPQWAQFHEFNAVIDVDVDKDNKPDYKIIIKKNSFTNHNTTLTENDVVIQDLTGKTVKPADRNKINLTFETNAHSISVNIHSDSDGKGGNPSEFVKKVRIKEDFNTARRMLSFEEREFGSDSAKTGGGPIKPERFPGFTTGKQALFRTLPADEKEALAAIHTYMQTLVQENDYEKLDFFILADHGVESKWAQQNRIQYEDKDGQKHSLAGSDVLKAIAPYVKNKIYMNVCLLADTNLIKSSAVKSTAKEITRNNKGLEIYVSDGIIITPGVNDPLLLNQQICTSKLEVVNVSPIGSRYDKKAYRATNGLIRIKDGEEKTINYTYEKEFMGTYGVYDKSSFGLDSKN